MGSLRDAVPHSASTIRRIDLTRELFSEDAAVVRDAISRLDEQAWQDLLETLSPAMLPYLDFALRARGLTNQLPQSVANRLTSTTEVAVLNELRQRSVLKQVLSRLARARLDAVLLKGAAFATALYPQPHLRPMSDIDIWVAAEDLSKSVRCLLDDGFEAAGGGAADGRLSPTLSQHRVRSISSDVRVELHGEVHSLECLSADRVQTFWRRAESFTIGDVRARMLCPDDGFVHTCLHLAMTNRFANSQLALFDVRLLLDKWSHRINWTEVADMAREEGIAVYLAVALKLSSRLWGTAVPHTYFARIGDIQQLNQLEELAMEQVMALDAAVPPALEQAFREPAGRARLASVAQRLFWQPHQWLYDLTIKWPRYVRAWKSGALSRSQWAHRTGLAARRGRIGALVDQAEAQLQDAYAQRGRNTSTPS